MHPDLANLEQFYIRTRADVTAGLLHGQEGIARVQANTITDAMGRIWAVDPMSPDPNRALFKAALPGQMPMSIDASQYVPVGGMPSPVMGMAPQGLGEYPSAALPVEPAESKSRFKRDKSRSAVKGGSPLDKLKDLPRFVWLAGALGVVLLLVALQLLSGSTSAPASSSIPATSDPISTPTTSAPAATTVPTTPAAPAGELSAARVTALIASLESLDVSRAQTAVLAPIDAMAYATFIGKHQSGERIVAAGDPVEVAGTPAATVTLRRVGVDGAELGTTTMILAKDQASGEWLFRELPAL